MDNKLRRILHVDDDPAMLRLLAPQLHNHGFEVFSIEDPLQVIPTLLNHDLRIVMLDIDMPGIHGLDLLERIKQHDGGVQVIMLTGLVSMSTVLESLRRGAEACFFKPVLDVAPLVESLEATVAKLHRWWQSLQDLSARKQSECSGGFLPSSTEPVRN